MVGYTVQKLERGRKGWVDVKTCDSLDDAICAALDSEKHAPLGQSRESDVSARIVQGRRVIWK